MIILDSNGVDNHVGGLNSILNVLDELYVGKHDAGGFFAGAFGDGLEGAHVAYSVCHWINLSSELLLGGTTAHISSSVYFSVSVL